MRPPKFNAFLLFFIIVAISGCADQADGAKQPTQATVLQQTIPPEDTPIPPTDAPTITPTPTLIPTETPFPLPTPRPGIDQIFINAISDTCIAAFSKRASGGVLQTPVLTLKEYDGQWYNRDFKIPFAEAKFAEEVQSLVCIMEEALPRGTYDDGAKAYQQRWRIRLVDFATGEVAAEKSFTGDNPPDIKWGGGDAYGSLPDAKPIREWIFKFYKMPVMVHSMSADSLAFSTDGQYLAVTAGWNNTRVWNLKSRQATSLTRGDPGSSYADTKIDYSPDGNILAFFADGDISYKIYQGKFKPPDLWGTRLQSFSLYVDFSPDGKTIAIGGYENNGTDASGNLDGSKPEGAIYLFDTTTGEQVTKIIRKLDLEAQQYESVFDNLSYSPDGKYLASSGLGQMMVYSPMSGTLLYSGNTGAVLVENNLAKLDGGPDEINRTARGLAFSPDSRLAAFGTAEGGIEVLNTSDWSVAASMVGHTNVVNALAFSPDGKLLASGGADNEIILWKVDGWKKLDQLSGHIGEVNTLAFSPDGSTLASGSRDSTVYLWDMTTY